MHQFPQVNMLDTDGKGRYVEILTPGGVVRVTTDLVDTRSMSPVVMVEIEQNIYGRARTAAGGDWDVRVVEHATGTRTDVRLEKR